MNIYQCCVCNTPVSQPCCELRTPKLLKGIAPKKCPLNYNPAGWKKVRAAEELGAPAVEGQRSKVEGPEKRPKSPGIPGQRGSLLVLKQAS